VCSKFSCVRLSHGLCACAHTHSLEGTLSAFMSCLADRKEFCYARNSYAASCSHVSEIALHYEFTLRNMILFYV